MTDDQVIAMVENVMSVRTEWLKSFGDPRRNVNKECGLPEGRLSREHYYQLYDRDPVAARVVEVLTKESWQVVPEVYEDEDPQTVTPFEGAWANLPTFLTPTKSYFDTKPELGGTVWEYLQRLDAQCGIGQFGVLLLGIDDGRPLWEPVEGVEEEGSTFSPENPEVGKKEKGKDPGYSPAGQLWDGTGPFPRKSYSLNMGGLRKGQEYTLNFGGPPPPGGTPPPGPPKPTATPSVAILRTDDPYKTGKPKQPPEWKPDSPLRYLRVFPEILADVVSFETNRASPRFGLPVEYLLILNDPRFGDSYGGIGLTTATVRVHWTRVLHVADNVGASEWAGMPRMQQVYNNLLGLQKLYCGSPEMYWRGAFPGLSIETNPQLGGDVTVDKEALKGGMEKYMNGLQRYLLLMGMSAKTLAPQVVDPTPQITAQIQAICIRLGIPQRVFMGSERGELASTQDDAAWNDRLVFRQKNFVGPKVVIPFVDRLIALGVLPPPKTDDKLCLDWPDLTSMSQSEKAAVSLQKTQAIAAYVAGGIDALIEPVDYLTSVMEYPDDQARQMIERASAHAEEKQQVQMDQQQAQIDAGLAVDPQEQADKAHQVAMTQAKNQPAGGGLPGTPGQPKPSGTLPGGKPPAFVKNERAVDNKFNPDQPRADDGKWGSGGAAPATGLPHTPTATADLTLHPQSPAGKRVPHFAADRTREGLPLSDAAHITPEQASSAVRWHDGMTMVRENKPNAGLPKETRPALTAGEAGALQKYSYKNDGPLNARLRGFGDTTSPYGDAFFSEMHHQLHSAFAKAQPFKPPKTVVRGMKLAPDVLQRFVEKMQGASKAGGHVEFDGYMSTAAPGGAAYKLGLGSGIPSAFQGNVSLSIKASKGLDVGPYSQLPGEGELLLDHKSKFKVGKVTKKGGGWHVELEQVADEQAHSGGVRNAAPLLTGGRWVTTDDGNHLYIKGSTVVAGNPHVVKAAGGGKAGKATQDEQPPAPKPHEFQAPDVKRGVTLEQFKKTEAGLNKGQEKISAEGKDALKQWSGLDTRFKQINEALRKGKKLDPEDQKHHDQLVKAIDEAGPTPAGTTVYRGMELGSTAKRNALLKQFEASVASGEPITMKSFSATTLDPNKAATLYGGKRHEAVIFEMSPKHGAYIGDLSGTTEKEFLMKPNAKFRVRAVHHDVAMPGHLGVKGTGHKVVQLEEIDE